MSISLIIPGQPWLSWILAYLVLVLVMYFIRQSAHQLLDNLTQLIIENLRILSKALLNTSKQMSIRNRDVLLEHGQQQAERELERQFIRLANLVEKDLSRYPTVQRDIEENITNMEDKLLQTSQVPSPLPEWTEAVESISKLKDSTKNDAVVGKLLQAIYEAFHKQQGEVMRVYRADIEKRHTLLKSAMNHWRRLHHKINEVGQDWQHLIKQAAKMDHQVERFENLILGTHKAENLLKSSNTTQFFISLVVMGIAGFGAFVNYNLIALPMSELMPATSQVAGYDVADIGAAVIIMLEITVGLFFMESIGITRLFPVIHFMEDKKRMIWAWVCIIFLLALCCVEAGLAYMREIMMADKSLLTNFLVGGEQAANEIASQPHSNIPMIGQMTLGFILPLILMFVAIPFESLVHTGRHLLGNMFVQICMFSSTLLRTLSVLIKHLNHSIKSIYDIVDFPPIWIEHLIENRPRKKIVLSENTHKTVSDSEEKDNKED
ncbi:MAG: hypothetical protein V7785_01445 [Bermanella sp.]